MRRLLRATIMVSAIATAIIAGSAHANFHLWEIDQVFSDASGNVQYVRFTALAGGQQSLSGHNVVSSLAGSPSKTYAFTTNLPSDSAGKKFLLATLGFAALNIVTPDYIVPNGFVFTPDGTINFAGDADALTYSSLPSNGTQAITRTGAIGAGAARKTAQAIEAYLGNCLAQNGVSC